ncbi:MAG: radical SAM family heme chaperone HemW [Eubacteriales bacterium]
MSFMQINTNEQKRLGLYFHIPFCLSKCAYCDFNSAPAPNAEIITRYISALISHMEHYRAGASVYTPDTVFIGGGTPTCIPPEELFRLIRAIRRNFRLTKNAEFTIEANPATVSYSTLLRLRRMGVNRLSMGLQSAHDIELKALSRRHSRKDFARSFRMARDAKFDNINVDLMFGIPHQTYQSLMHTLSYVTRMGPEHLSLYDLKIEPGTAFYRSYNEIAPYLPDDDTEADMYLGAVEYLQNCGYMQYEISNFARPGHMCAHNLKYWNCDEYLGFGVSAHSYFNGSRFSFTADLGRYLQGVEGILENRVRITDECETVEERERVGEYIMLRLRLCAGIDSREFMRRFGLDFDAVYGVKCTKYIQNGFMTCKNGVYALTPSGMFISNYILSDLLEFEDFGRYYFGN